MKPVSYFNIYNITYMFKLLNTCIHTYPPTHVCVCVYIWKIVSQSCWSQMPMRLLRRWWDSSWSFPWIARWGSSSMEWMFGLESTRVLTVSSPANIGEFSTVPVLLCSAQTILIPILNVLNRSAFMGLCPGPSRNVTTRSLRLVCTAWVAFSRDSVADKHFGWV